MSITNALNSYKNDASIHQKDLLESIDFPNPDILSNNTTIYESQPQYIETYSKTYLKETPIIPEIFIQQNITKQNNFVSLQKWEGYVLNVEEDVFNVRLVDLTNNGTDEEAILHLEDVSEDDKDLVIPGAVFYWNIGYMDTVSGQRCRSSIIKFRRLPQWSSAEMSIISEKVKIIKEKINWE